jgi:nucleotide-binding universal stress UspA family protein
MYKKILVPLDGSEHAEKVLPFVCTVAESSNAQIVLLRIVEYPYYLYAGCDEYSLLDPEFTKKTDERKKAICDALTLYTEQIASNLQQEGFRVIAKVCEGPVVDAILDTIDRLEIDLVAMSAQGGGRGNPWMIGSVAVRVLRESTVQVFLFRPDQGKINPGYHKNPQNSFTRTSNEKHEIRLWPGSFS